MKDGFRIVCATGAALLLIGEAAFAQTAPEPSRRGMESVHQPVVTPYGASVPSCPGWGGADHRVSEAQSTNYGCATASNLAAMIANPQDLIHGQSSSGPDAETAAKAVKSWRETVPSGKGGTIEKSSSKGS